jgi:hypothetical protein
MRGCTNNNGQNMSSPTRTLLSKSTLLLLALLIMTLFGQFVPESGILVLGFLVALSIELTRIRFRENHLAVTLTMFSTLTLVWGWIGPNISFLSRPLALAMFFAWGVYCLNSNQNTLRRHWSIPSIATLVLSVVIYLQDSHHMVAPLLMGYDNSAHVPALSQVYRHSGFLYSGSLPELFTFGNYVRGYPPLQSATSAFIMSIGNVKISGGYEILNYFGFFYFGLALLIVSLVTKYWINGSSRLLNSQYRIVGWIAIGLLVMFSQASYIFWLGFPPFLFACGITVAIVKITNGLKEQSHRVLVGVLGITLVNYSYPLLSPVLVLILLFELMKLTKEDLNYLWSHRKYVAPFILMTVVLNIAVVLKSLNVRHYFNDGGGIQPIEMRNLLPIFVLVVLVLFFSWESFKSLPVVVIAFIASCVNFGILAVFSQLDQGSISYYPQKAGYLALILGFAALGNSFDKIPRFQKPFNTKTFNLLTVLLSVGTLWFSVETTSNPTYAKYGFVSTSTVWDQVKNKTPNPGRSCFLRAMDITADLNSNSDYRTILYLQDDLGTRWINGIRGRLTDATYSISIPVGQGTQTLPEVLHGWFNQYPLARLLILAPEPPPGLDEWSDKIEFRQFACT